jgi:hypothetical protein
VVPRARGAIGPLVQAVRATGLAWVIAAAGFIGGGMLVMSEFMAVRYVKTLTASCQDLAQPSLRDSCLVIGHESHVWGFLLLGLFALVMTFGCAVGGSRPAAVALLVAGVAGLAIVLLHDLPKTSQRGEVGQAYADAHAHKGAGFWFGLVGSALVLGAGGLATWRTPPRYEARRRPETAVGEPPDPAEPEEAPA